MYILETRSLFENGHQKIFPEMFGRYIVEERATSGDNGGPQGKIIYPWGLVPKKSYSPRKFGPTCAIHPLPPPAHKVSHKSGKLAPLDRPGKTTS